MWRLVLAALVAAGMWGAIGSADEDSTVRLAIHVHSTVSTGDLTPEHILALAESASLDGVVFTDSAVRRWEYGVWPLRHLFKWTVEQPSIATLGPARYLELIEQAARAHPRLLVIPGVEVTPFYYWHRSPLDRRGGQIRAGNNHLLVIGLHDPELIRQLPLNVFDPYQGNQGAKPYQRLIDVVIAHGGAVYWAHPMAAFRAEKAGNSEALVEPYPHLLETTSGYHGIALANAAALTLVEPGALWDQLLLAYGQGRRTHPVWILGELDWRRPAERPLDQVMTVLRDAERTEPAVVRALRAGKAWVVFRRGVRAPALLRYTVTDVATNESVSVGETLASLGALRIEVSAEGFEPVQEPIRVALIQDGRVIREEEAPGDHAALAWTQERPTQATFYRLWIEHPSATIYTNPIFVIPPPPAS